MTAHLTEEEQLETLKRWWAENGKSTVIAVVLAVAGYLGWNSWQDSHQANAEQASATYQTLMEALANEPGQELSEEQVANVTHLAGELKEKHKGNLYASQAAMFLAKLAVDKGDLDGAAAELQWVIDRDVDKAVTLLARARLARVKIAQQDYAAALALVQETRNPAFTATFAEIRGDILLQQGNTQEARAAYRLAMDNLVPGLEGRAQLLQIKLDDLQTSPVVVTQPSQADEALESENLDGAAGENS